MLKSKRAASALRHGVKAGCMAMVSVLLLLFPLSLLLQRELLPTASAFPAICTIALISSFFAGKLSAGKLRPGILSVPVSTAVFTVLSLLISAASTGPGELSVANFPTLCAIMIGFTLAEITGNNNMLNRKPFRRKNNTIRNIRY